MGTTRGGSWLDRSDRTRAGPLNDVAQRWCDSTERFEAFYEVHSPGLLRYFVRSTRDVESAFDLTAETFTKAFEKRGSFRGRNEAQGVAWIWAIARNELARYRRDRHIEERALQRLGDERLEDAVWQVREDRDGLEAARQRINEALERLPPAQQLVLSLRFGHDLDAGAVGVRLGIPSDAVRARLSRAYRRLRVSREVQEAVHELETS